MFNNQKLLENEESFLKLNTELDNKTRDLLQEVDLVMKQQASDQETLTAKWSEQVLKENERNELETELSFGINADCKSSEEHDSGNDRIPGKARRSVCASTTNLGQGVVFPGTLTRHKSDLKLREKSMDNVLPESMKGVGQESVIRFLKAKVKMLSDQVETVQADEKKHVEKIKELQNDRDRVAEDRDKWIQQAYVAKNVLVKHEQHASNIVVQLQNIQAENGHLKREVEKLKKELKQITQSSGSNEVRLNRSMEETEKLKAALRQAKQDEKDLKETHRKKTEELSAAVRRLDKQRIELLHAFKKQLVIIDNLKKQKGLIEVGKSVKSIEDDFMEFLDWNPGNG